MADTQSGGFLLPGVKGKDYHLVKGPEGKIYAVYRVKLPNGKVIRMTWSIPKSKYKAYGVNPGQVPSIGRQAFKQMQFFGQISEVIRRGDNRHPWQQFLSRLKEQYGPVSFLQNKEFMGVMLMGWFEGWSQAELQQRLSRTEWFKNRTAAQRNWQLNMKKADREAASKNMATQVKVALDELYGAASWQNHGINDKLINQWATKIASGELGDPSDGFQVWLYGQKQKAEKIEGTAAWIRAEQEAEDRRDFLSRPDEMVEKLREQAREWLGPKAVPDDTTLRKWATRIVTQQGGLHGTDAESEWTRFLQGQARSLYPYLSEGEIWMERASAYKRIAEENLGRPIKWESDLLNNLEGVDKEGSRTGLPRSFDDFQEYVRNRPEFWRGSVANEAGFGLVTYLNENFNGVGVQ